MALHLNIVKSPKGVTATESSKTFSELGGTIGRGDDNDWALPDPERYLSACHCQISCENGQYFLTDLSTNGTFVNNSVEPIGKGGRIQLSDGDAFEVGDYRFDVSLWSTESDSASPFDVSSSFDSPKESSFSDPFADVHAPSAQSVYGPVENETDPLVALDKARQVTGDNKPADIFSSNTHTDGADAMNQAVNWPNSIQDSALIPEDWDDDLNFTDQAHAAIPRSLPLTDPPQFNDSLSLQKAAVSQPVPATNKKSAAAAAKEGSSRKQSVQKSRPRPVSKKKPENVKAYTVDRTMIDALGLAEHDLDDQQVKEINQVVGELMRETIIGMMQILRSRASIKNEFRMNITTIQPVENNPLKFSANIDEALENMFIKKSNAYKKPIEAMQESFRGIAEHQVALLAGIRMAFKSMMERFDPTTLENQFERKNKSVIIPGFSKAKYWSAYIDQYQSLIDNMESSFQYLFGDEFVQAYEDQLRKLAAARKKDTLD